jgi:hypothetical protein
MTIAELFHWLVIAWVLIVIADVALGIFMIPVRWAWKKLS